MYSVGMLDKGMLHVLGRMERDGVRFHYTTKSDAQFKTDELFISGSFHLIIFEPWLSEGN